MDRTRTCSKCNQTKPIEEFSKHKACRDGYQQICKECKNAYLREYMANSADQRRKKLERKWAWREDPENRAYANAKQYANQNKDPEKRALTYRRHQLKKWYGVTLEDYDRIIDQQGRGCAICGNGPSGKHKYLQFDHDHACCPTTPTCGKCVRGLLCSGCNTGLGLFNDDPARLLDAIQYLEEWGVT